MEREREILGTLHLSTIDIIYNLPSGCSSLNGLLMVGIF